MPSETRPDKICQGQGQSRGVHGGPARLDACTSAANAGSLSVDMDMDVGVGVGICSHPARPRYPRGRSPRTAVTRPKLRPRPHPSPHHPCPSPSTLHIHMSKPRLTSSQAAGALTASSHRREYANARRTTESQATRVVAPCPSVLLGRSLSKVPSYPRRVAGQSVYIVVCGV